MKKLHIYPTSRAIRNERLLQKEENALLPSLMRVDDFERRAILLPNRAMVDSLQRMLFLKEASKFEGFNRLKINRDLIKFFTKSDAIFKFFEELSHEKVSFEALVEGDAYIEFGEHLDILEELLNNYNTLLESKGLTDRVFIPLTYQLNNGFIESYDGFELYLEGYMSYFELEIIEKISKNKPFIIHLHTSKFNKKVQERFFEMGVDLPNDSYVSFDLQNKKILSTFTNEIILNSKVFSTEERLAQIPILLEGVQNMVNSGIPPDEIVVILPDESFKESIRLYDKLNNFNFAMGFDYNKTKAYKRLESVYLHLKSFSDETLFLIKKYGINPEDVNKLTPNLDMNVDSFFKIIEPFNLEEKRSIIEENFLHFKNIFKEDQMSMISWFFLWLKQLSTLTLDDVRGGKITVLGALETRGVSFKGVIIIDFNDGVVPSIPAKDAFLNSSLRKFAKLPTKNDRTALQKQLYKRILEQAEDSIIIYSTSNNKVATSYLYELGLTLGTVSFSNLELLYNEPNQVISEKDPVIQTFDASTITWSPTRLKIFLTCKRKYYYTYFQKLRAKEEETLNEGRFLHKVLEHLFDYTNSYLSNNDIKMNLDQCLDRLLETSNPNIEYSKLLWKAKMETFLEAQVYHFKAGWKVIEREKHIIGNIGGINFKGVVDRIDQDEVGTLILDYKSGSISDANRSKNLEKLTDFQMSIYSEILKPIYKNMNLFFIEIFNGKSSEITKLEEKTELLYEIINDLRATKKVVASKCEDVTLCQYCDYTLLCDRGVYL